MNYKQACLKRVAPIVCQPVEPVKPVIEDEQAKWLRSWEKTVQTLSKRWEKYKEDYIALYGEDTYHYMYSTPNYWVMPEDNDMEEDKQEECSEEEEEN